jgi:hypothetical protein
VHKDRLAPLVLKAHRVLKVPLQQHPGHKVLQVLKGLQALKAHKELKDPQAPRGQ